MPLFSSPSTKSWGIGDIGDLTSPGEDPAGRTEVVAERLLPLQVPLVFEAPFGHAGRNQPVLFGVSHLLDAGEGRLVQSG